MAILGFRRPQFSEEAAWLPEWLQNSQASAFDKLTKESDKSQIKVSEENGNERKASEDGHYNNCCLFLSGADNSAYSLASPSASVMRLNLHLSSDGNLQYTQSLSLSNYRVDTAKASTLQSEKVRMPVEARQNTSQFYSLGTLGSASSLAKPAITANPDVAPKSPFSKEKTHMQRSSDGPHNYGNFDHAVELSVAASEALLIHELLEKEESSALVKASTLLDISLKMKQARLLRDEDDSLSSDHLYESSEYLSDIDDSAMVDAFVDVGLCTTSSGDCYVSDSLGSRVNETPLINLEPGYNFEQSEVPTPLVALNCATEKMSEENRDMDGGVKLTDGEYPVLKFDINGLEMMTSSLENAKLKTTELQAGFNMPEADSSRSKTQLAANSSQSQDHEQPEDCQLKQSQLGGHNSCWFGGWTTKDYCPKLTLDTGKCNVKALAVETSSLSESVDVPDKGSYVDGQDLTCTAANVVTLANMVEDDAFMPIEIAKHPSSSSVDPLCSVVPCTYQSETPQSVNNGNVFQKGGEYPDENDPCHASKLLHDSISLTSEQLVKVQGATTMNDKDSGLEVQRQLTSLNNYSLVLPSRNAITNASHFKSTSAANSCCKGHHSIVNLTNDVTVCNNNASGGAGFLTLPPGQRLSALTIRGINLPQALEGQCTDNNVDCCASQRLLDNFPQGKKTHACQTELAQDIQVIQRKRVHFKEFTSELEQTYKRRKTGIDIASNLNSKMLRTSKLEPERETFSQEVKMKLTNYRPCNRDKLIFRGLDFLLTGLPKKREKHVKQLIIRYGGIVLFDIPSPNLKRKISLESHFQKLPVVLCLKKVETTKFLYGCAVNACILKVDWLLDSVSAGSVLQPEKYMIFPNQRDGNHFLSRSPNVCKLVFEGVGIMFHGKHKFCSRLSRIFQYGGGRVFKALQRLIQSSERNNLTIQAVVAEDRSMVSRHLKHCATERNIPIVSATWIISSLLSGKLLPFTENDYNFPNPMRKASRQMLPLTYCQSQEI